MAGGFKDILRWALGWKSAAAEVVPDTPGLEWTLPGNESELTLPENRPHFHMPEKRAHFAIPSE